MLYNIMIYGRVYAFDRIVTIKRKIEGMSRHGRRRVESKRRLGTVYTEVGGEGRTRIQRPDSRTKAKRRCRTAVFHGRFGSDVDRDDKRERRTVTGRREKKRSPLPSPSLLVECV